jgi:hypothetical protein
MSFRRQDPQRAKRAARRPPRGPYHGVHHWVPKPLRVDGLTGGPPRSVQRSSTCASAARDARHEPDLSPRIEHRTLRVCGQLVQGHRNRLCHVLLQDDGRPNLGAHLPVSGIGRRLLLHEMARAAPVQRDWTNSEWTLASASMRPAIASLRPSGVSACESCTIAFTFADRFLVFRLASESRKHLTSLALCSIIATSSERRSDESG